MAADDTGTALIPLTEERERPLKKDVPAFLSFSVQSVNSVQSVTRPSDWLGIRASTNEEQIPRYARDDKWVALWLTTTI